MSNCCLETKCLQCCKETNMILSNRDIKKITKFGYNSAVFFEEHHGWIQLKNTHGRCVFHDGNKCAIYEHRPKGCTLYPVVYDTENQRAFLDDECPHKQYFPLSKTEQQQLNRLVLTLQKERAERIQQKKSPAKATTKGSKPRLK